VRDVALFGHLVGAVAFFAGLAVAALAQRAALRVERPSEVALLLGLARRGVLLVAAGLVLVVGFGAWLVEETAYGLGDGWLAASLALLVLAVVLGAVGGRRPRRTRALATRLEREGDRPSEELSRMLADPASLAVNGAAGLAALAVLALMVWKPA
jgi:uncharacterized membrane protein